MDPAYQIVLSDAQLAVLGEITVIMGQIDEEMIRTVSGLIGADRPTTEAVMGSTRTENNSDIWRRLVGSRTKDPDILWLVELAMKEFPEVQRGRNNFIHADFAVEAPVTDENGAQWTFGSPRINETHRDREGKRLILGFVGPIIAKRVRNGRKTPISEMEDLRYPFLPDRPHWLGHGSRLPALAMARKTRADASASTG